jgi:hypothetical protein
LWKNGKINILKEHNNMFLFSFAKYRENYVLFEHDLLPITVFCEKLRQGIPIKIKQSTHFEKSVTLPAF